MYPFALLAILAFQDPATSLSTEEAKEIQRLEELVAVGAMAPARLAEAKQKVADSQDSAILNRTLYGKISLEDFTDQQAAEMIAAAERRLARQQENVDRQNKLVEAGVLARVEIAPAIAELDARKAVVDVAKARAHLVQEIVDMANAEQVALSIIPAPASNDDGHAPVVEHFQGVGRFGDGDLKRVTLEFEKEFSRPLPVSAKGETAVHKSLGFDHRGRVDVGLNPDSSEGQWIRKYLAENHIPYIAFRRAVSGQATAPHIHIGPPSPRLTSAD
jgi:hypothetical protein